MEVLLLDMPLLIHLLSFFRPSVIRCDPKAKSLFHLRATVKCDS
jgi:hypothetical protein